MPFDPQTGEYFVGTLADFRARTAAVGGLMALAMEAQIVQLTAYFAGLSSSTVPFLASLAAESPLLFWAPPVLAFEAVMAALGSGYAAARTMVKNENSASGYSQGLVCGVLGWNKNQTLSIIGRHTIVPINAVDETTDMIRVNAFNRGLRVGFAAGTAYPPELKKSFRIVLRKAAGLHGGGAWSNDQDEARLQQVDYVIRLSSNGRRVGLIR